MLSSVAVVIALFLLLIILIIFIYMCTGTQSTLRKICNACPAAEELLEAPVPDTEEEQAGLIRRQEKVVYDFTDRIILITGCDKGIGKQTLRVLAKTKATVIMACRDLNAARLVQNEIMEQTGNSHVIALQLDLSELASIKRFADEFKHYYNKIDTLILNAGVLPLRPGLTTKDDFELAFGVNCIGNLCLLLSVQDLLQNAGDNEENRHSRVIVVSDYTHRRDLGLYGFRPFDYDVESVSDAGYDGYTAYRYSKLCLSMVMKHFAETHAVDDSKMLCVSVFPGFGETELYGTGAEDEVALSTKDVAFQHHAYGSCCSNTLRGMFCVDRMMDSVGQLAYSTVYCAVADQSELEHGAFYRGSEKVSDVDPLILQKQAARQLYNKCVELMQRDK